MSNIIIASGGEFDILSPDPVVWRVVVEENLDLNDKVASYRTRFVVGVQSFQLAYAENDDPETLAHCTFIGQQFVNVLKKLGVKPTTEIPVCQAWTGASGKCTRCATGGAP